MGNFTGYCTNKQTALNLVLCFDQIGTLLANVRRLKWTGTAFHEIGFSDYLLFQALCQF